MAAAFELGTAQNTAIVPWTSMADLGYDRLPSAMFSQRIAVEIGAGQCEGVGAVRAAKKFGFSRTRYFQIRKLFLTQGSDGLRSHKTGPKTNYRRTDELVRQVIRHRFLDPEATPEVIAQKLRQCNFVISTRSVERVIAQYGLQKKLHQCRPGAKVPV